MTDHATQASPPAADLPADDPTRSLAVASVDAPGVPVVGIAGGHLHHAIERAERGRRARAPASQYRTEMLGP
jgi:hypothetical protein